VQRHPHYRSDSEHCQLPLFEDPEHHTAHAASMQEAAPQSALGIPIYRVTLVRESALAYHELPQMRSSKDVAQLLRAYLQGVDREYFVVLFVDQKNRLTGIHTVSMGSLTGSIVHPREVFKAAILAQAAAIICGHNHPSGDLQPSREDRAMTTRLYQAGKLLGIQVLDHIIIGSEGKHFSFADEGLLDASAA
jgi:DNA repair protein RadC